MSLRPSDRPPSPGPVLDEETFDWIHAHLAADAALLRRLIKLFADHLMVADADRQCRAEPDGTGERVNRRNGYRRWMFETAAGSVPLAVPRLRRGVYAPRWLLDAPAATADTIEDAACRGYVDGVDPTAVSALAIALGMVPLSTARIDAVAAALDAAVSAERERPLGGAPYDDVWLLSCGQASGHGVTRMTARIAIGSVGSDERDVLGLAMTASDEETGWRQLLRNLRARGLEGVAVVRSDRSSAGLARAVAAAWPEAAWDGPAAAASAPAPAMEGRTPPAIVVRDHGRLRHGPSWPEPPPPDRAVGRRRREVPALAGVAAVILAVMLAVVWRHESAPNRPVGPSPSTSAVAPVVASPAPPPAPVPTTAPPAATASTIVTCPDPPGLAATNPRSPWLQQVLCAATAGP